MSKSMYDQSLRSLPQLGSREKPHPRSATKSVLHYTDGFRHHGISHCRKDSGYLEIENAFSECDYLRCS